MSKETKQADFAVIRQRVTMKMLLEEHYKINLLFYKREGRDRNELRGNCPIHTKSREGEAGERSFSANYTKNIFQCFKCGAKGNVIDLVAKIENCSLRDAGLKIWEWFSLDDETSSPTAPTPPEPRGEPQANQPTLEERVERLERILALIFSEGLIDKIAR